MKKNTSSTVTLIDLAGSEKASGTSLRVKEGVYINKSLLALGKVINSLNKNEFTSYRESKLTRVLKSTIKGNVMLIALCMISPDEKCVDESVNTLNFASRPCEIEIKNEIHTKENIENESYVCAICKNKNMKHEQVVTINELTDSSSLEEFGLVKSEKYEKRTEKIINLQSKRIKDLENTIVSLIGELPSQRESEFFLLEKTCLI